MDAIVLCGGRAERLNAFSCTEIDKVKIFEEDLIQYLRLLDIRKIYFLGWEYENDEKKNIVNKQHIYYIKYPNMEGSFKEIISLIRDTDIIPPFVLVYGDVLENWKEKQESVWLKVKKYNTLTKLGYDIIMHVANVLFDYEDGNIAIHNTKPMVMDYGIKNSSWIDAGFFYINSINTKSKAENWSNYIREQVEKRRVGYILVDRPFEINTPYSLYLSQLKHV